MAMAAVAGTAAVVGHLPRQSSTIAIGLSSSRAQFGAQCFRFRGRLHLQTSHHRRSVVFAQNSAQTEAKVLYILPFLLHNDIIISACFPTFVSFGTWFLSM